MTSDTPVMGNITPLQNRGFDYLAIELYCHGVYDVQANASAYSTQGWELVTVVPPHIPAAHMTIMSTPHVPNGPYGFVFKRPRGW